MLEVGLFFFSELLPNVAKADAPHGTQSGNDEIVVPGVEVQLFYLDVGRTGGDCFQVEREGGDIPLPAFPVIGMGGGADAQLCLACPGGTVVPGEAAGPCEIGNLVMEVSGIGQLIY